MDHFSWLALLGLIGLLAAAHVFRTRYPLASYGIVVFLILLLPTSSIVPIKDTLVERRMYLPLIGLICVVLEALSRVKVSKPALAAGLAGVLVVLGALTYQRNQVWSSSVALWKDAVEGAPGKYRPRFQLAFAYYLENRCGEALREYEQARRIGPVEGRLLANMSLAAECTGDKPRAFALMEEAAKVQASAEVYAALAMLYGKHAEREKAFQALTLAESLNPRLDSVYQYRGNLYFDLGQLDRAAEQYRRALELRPDNEAARVRLGETEQLLRQKRPST
jgi:tetratricopeptide (TPR) repeat protein